jgi:2-haloacid dehalogenase
MHEQTILFDINETVLNLDSLKPKFNAIFGDKSYTATWFSMLLHSSTVCLVTGVKTDFASLAKIALDALAAKQKILLSEEEGNDILATFANLAPHKDIQSALTKLRKAGFRLVALSNSSQALLTTQIRNAGLTGYFDELISVEAAGTFKPSANAYAFASKQLETTADKLRLVATHDWDTHGALSAGLKAAYIDRTGAPYNPLFLKPDVIGSTMDEIAEQIISIHNI